MTNVVLIVADDMRADLLPFAQWINGFMRPNGLQLTAMRCEIPLCSPARAALLTGRHAYDSENLVYQNADSPASPSTHCLPVWLQSVTASTAIFGKYMSSGASTVQPGWDRWCVFSASAQEAYNYTIKQEDTTTSQPGLSPTFQHQLTYLREQMEAYISTVSEPFFMLFAPTSPHINNTTFGCNPLPGTVEKFSWWNPPLDHELNDSTDILSKPIFRPGLNTEWTETGRHLLKQSARAQAQEVYDMDTVCKAIYDAIVARGGSYLANTLFIFVSDSGVTYEEQRLLTTSLLPAPSYKDEPFDHIAKIPCVIMGPDVTARSTSDIPMTLQDITAMIVDVLGATPSVTLRGTNPLTLIANNPADRDTLYERQDNADLVACPDARGIVRRTRKLIKYVGQTPGNTYEMYDLDTDPNEYRNVAYDSGRLTERGVLETAMNLL